MLDGSWLDGWRAFCESVKPNYIKTAARAFAADSTARERGKFAHYLDCEAHTDVWRELYKTANHTNEK